MSYEVHNIGGNCPVQAEGVIDGLPFYFRARGEHWSFRVADKPDGDPVDGLGFYYEEDYMPGDTFAAGWMEESEAREFIAKAALLYEEAMTKKREVRAAEMIRFIDLGKQIAVDETDPEWPRQFAFFDTVSDSFLTLGGNGQVWDSWFDILRFVGDEDGALLDRLWALSPEWTKEGFVLMRMCGWRRLRKAEQTRYWLSNTPMYSSAKAH